MPHLQQAIRREIPLEAALTRTQRHATPQVRNLSEKLHTEEPPQRSPANTHRGAALRMRLVQQTVQLQKQPQFSQENSLGRETAHLRGLRTGFCGESKFDGASTDTYRGKALRLRSVP